MFCSVCGRKLKSPASISVGCGPVCYRKLHGTTLESFGQSRKETIINQTDMECDDIPGQISLEDYLKELEDK